MKITALAALALAALASTARSFGTARGGGPLSEDKVVCPGNDAEDYCNCEENDCENEDGRDLCFCDEARECCGHVLCPGFDPEEYCECGEEDCEIHATGQCGCEAAQSESCCGKDSEEEVVCPGFDDDDFCDCETDCTEKPEQCACAEAKACCSD